MRIVSDLHHWGYEAVAVSGEVPAYPRGSRHRCEWYLVSSDLAVGGAETTQWRCGCGATAMQIVRPREWSR